MTSSATQKALQHVIRLGALLCIAVSCGFFPAARAQNLDKPLINIDDDINAFAYAPMAASFTLSIAISKPRNTTSNTTTFGSRKPMVSATACSKARNSAAAPNCSATSWIPFAGHPTAT